MLVLARKTDQSVMIGDDVEITIVEIRSDQVKLGIRAPKSVAVHRKEVYVEIQKENLAAQTAPSPSGIGDVLRNARRPK